MSQWAAQLEYEEVHEAFLANNDPSSTPAGSCFEITIGTAPQLWAAYNPHAAVTTSTRGHRLEFEQLIIQVESDDIAMVEPEGGTDLSGTTGPNADDLVTTFETDALVGYTAPEAMIIPLGGGTAIIEAKAITSDSTWEELGGIVVSPGLFRDDGANLYLRGLGQVISTDAGAELRVVKASDSEVMMASPHALGDVGSAWALLKFDTDPGLPLSTEAYILEGRLNGATSASVRYLTLLLLDEL